MYINFVITYFLPCTNENCQYFYCSTIFLKINIRILEYVPGNDTYLTDDVRLYVCFSMGYSRNS
jgi:hypothetical protein